MDAGLKMEISGQDTTLLSRMFRVREKRKKNEFA